MYNLVALTQNRVGVTRRQTGRYADVWWNTWVGPSFEHPDVIRKGGEALLVYGRMLRASTETDAGAPARFTAARAELERIAEQHSVELDELIKTCARVWAA